jgi:CRISPR/Cas system CSM-associated protein Csm3 (group 7 of RAMP superfamily)
VSFKIISRISEVETIAAGRKIRELRRLRKRYGGRSWRKLKGAGTVEFDDGTICEAELHWYQAHGVGAKEYKIKRIFSVQ